MTDNANEKVLFELRITDAGTTVTTSAEWDAYHAQRFPRPPWTGRIARWAAWMDEHCETEPRQPAKTDLRAALDSLQAIYDDLYAAPAEG